MSESVTDVRKNLLERTKRLRVYRQHIRQSQYQHLKVEEHLRVCGNGEFRIFTLLQMRS